MGRGDGESELASCDEPLSRSSGGIDRLRERVSRSAGRIALLGGWPEWIDPQESLTGRIPSDSLSASGFDAGVACCLDLIPRSRQRLSAILHAAYTPEAIRQVVSESDPAARSSDSETAWWLAACSVCREERLSPLEFLDQVDQFKRLRESESDRAAAAWGELERMRSLFELRDGIPFSSEDGGMQGAYISGHPLAVGFAESEGIWFIGTPEESLGLEEFEWADGVDDLGRSTSGPVHGSRQFVRAASEDELASAISMTRAHLGV